MFKNILIHTIRPLWWIGLLACTACGQQQQKEKEKTTAEQAVLPHYSLGQPQVYELPKVLNEISGIAFNNGNADVVFAEQDEEGKLFRYRLGDQNLTDIKFGKKGDYEDVQVSGNYIVLLRSDGTLYSFPLSEAAGPEVESTREWKDLLPEGEYESLYADGATGKLYVLCKDCGGKKEEGVMGYVLQMGSDGSVTPVSNFSIAVGGLAEKAGVKRANFQPSALAWNARSNQWFIVSSTGGMLVTADTNWKVTGAYPLDKDLYNQPEGMTFDAAGNLYISNECGTRRNATILKIDYQAN
jgi:uncharacterized protein YjiK